MEIVVGTLHAGGIRFAEGGDSGKDFGEVLVRRAGERRRHRQARMRLHH